MGVVLRAEHIFASDSQCGLTDGSLPRRLLFGAMTGADGMSTCLPTELKRRGILLKVEEDFTLDVLTCLVCKVTGFTRLH